MTVLSQYLDRLAGMEDEKFVGSLVTYTVTDVSVTRAEVVKIFLELGLDEKHVPPEIKQVDAFKKVTTEAKIEYDTPWLGKDRRARIMIREVASTDDAHVRHIIRENVDANGKVLSYDKVGEAIFYRGSTPGMGKPRYSLADAKFSAPEEAGFLAEWIKQVHDKYLHKADHLDAQALRAVLRNYIVALNGIAVKPSGGVYFVHKTRQDTIDSLQEFIRRIPGRSVLYVIPLIDTPEQREMLTEAFQTEVEEECQSLLVGIASAADAKRINKRTADALLARYSSLSQRAEEYTRTLGLSQERAAAALEMAFDAMTRLLSKVDG